MEWIAGEPERSPRNDPPPAGERRRWLGILFRCCQAYGRIYKTASGDAYVGQCPRCAAEIRVGVGSGGTSQRFFEAG